MKPEDVPEDWVKTGLEAHKLYPYPSTFYTRFPTADEARMVQIRWIAAALYPLMRAHVLAEQEAEHREAVRHGVARFIEGRHDNEVRAMIAQAYPNVTIKQLLGPELPISDIRKALADRAGGA